MQPFHVQIPLILHCTINACGRFCVVLHKPNLLDRPSADTGFPHGLHIFDYYDTCALRMNANSSFTWLRKVSGMDYTSGKLTRDLTWNLTTGITTGYRQFNSLITVHMKIAAN